MTSASQSEDSHPNLKLRGLFVVEEYKLKRPSSFLTPDTMDPLNDENIEMYFYENRLKTYEGWPFDEDCMCTPENVSERPKRSTKATTSKTRDSSNKT